MRIWFQTLKQYLMCSNFTDISLLRCEKQTYLDFNLNLYFFQFIIFDTMRHSCIFLSTLLHSSPQRYFPWHGYLLCMCTHVTKPFMLNQVFQCLNVHGWFTVQGGDVVFVYNQRAQSFMPLPELSSAELPVRDDETVSDIFFFKFWIHVNIYPCGIYFLWNKKKQKNMWCRLSPYRKFSAVFGTTSANSSTFIRPRSWQAVEKTLCEQLNKNPLKKELHIHIKRWVKQFRLRQNSTEWKWRSILGPGR